MATADRRMGETGPEGRLRAARRSGARRASAGFRGAAGQAGLASSGSTAPERSGVMATVETWISGCTYWNSGIT